MITIPRVLVNVAFCATPTLEVGPVLQSRSHA
jgi:hypothetical protein